eukprot:5799322-Amphidinium_carterae.2
MEDWHRIDTQSSTTLWLDHSISAWCATGTQWHLNEHTAITIDAQCAILEKDIQRILREQ